MRNAELRIDVSTGDDGATVVTVAGPLDERADLVAAAHTLSAPLIADLAGVEFVNSDGVVEWVQFLRAALARGRVTLRACSEPMVTLFNMVSTAVDGAHVESISVPYFCATCNAESSVLTSITDELRGPTPALIPPTCSECSAVMMLAGVAERYLAFLRSP